MEKHKLPLRIGVGIIVLNDKNHVFVGKRKDNPGDKWQMPQGGLNKGENFIAAMKRELMEETGIKKIKILKEIDRMYEYTLPDNLIGIIWKGKFKGQKQKWFIVKYLGKDEDININTKHPEFVNWKWINPNKLPGVIVKFKKDLYVDLLKEINSIID